MAESTLKLSIVTPTRRVLLGLQVLDVTLPSLRGQIQVLPEHDSLMTVLETGAMAYRDLQNKVNYLAISYGYAEIQKNEVLVLAHTAESKEQIDLERAVRALERAQKTVLEGTDLTQLRKYELKIQRALVRQQIAKL